MKIDTLVILLIAQQIAGETFKVTTFNQGQDNFVNSHIVENSDNIVIIDVQGSSRDAEKVADIAEQIDKDVKYIIITHGHPDHFYGISSMHSRFPDATIIVATENQKQDMINFVNLMLLLGSQVPPEIIPKSETNPDGFDYDKLVKVLNDDKLDFPGGGTFRVDTDFMPVEQDHEST